MHFTFVIRKVKPPLRSQSQSLFMESKIHVVK